MSRGKRTIRRRSAPDHKYKSELLNKFICYVMRDGKKTTAERIVYGALDIIGAKKNEPPLAVFDRVVEATRPQVEVRSRRVGGANYQIPMPVSGVRQNALAFRWIIGAARDRKGRNMEEKLAAELLDILEGVGGTIKKKADVHRMAEANKAFAHFAW
ncbi:MAG: 30S ribosomal protein S7 [Patescibacteria group bacterium]